MASDRVTRPSESLKYSYDFVAWPFSATIVLHGDIGAPVMVSYPHFYRSDPSLLEPFTGLNPDGEKHSMKIDVHSRLGLTLSGVSRLQLNVLVRPYMKHFNGVPDGMVLPIAWFEMSLPPFDEDYLRLLRLASKALDIMESLLLYGLPLAALCSIYALLRLYFTLRLRTFRPSPIVLASSLPKVLPVLGEVI